MGSVDYRDLDVWKKAMDLAVETHKLGRMLPKEEQYALADQMRRAAYSIPSNISEGQARGTAKEFTNFLRIARGSLCELQTQLLLSVRCELVPEDAINIAMGLSEEVARMLNKLILAIQK